MAVDTTRALRSIKEVKDAWRDERRQKAEDERRELIRQINGRLGTEIDPSWLRGALGNYCLTVPEHGPVGITILPGPPFNQIKAEVKSFEYDDLIQALCAAELKDGD
jgi:hypothetical protein